MPGMTRASDTWGSKAVPNRVAARAATRFVVEGECHVSTYSAMNQGYAQVGWGDTDDEGRKRVHMVLAHRAAWVHYTGEQVPVGVTVDHTCPVRNRKCVRREHLRLLPNLENARRTNGWDWPLGTCRQGHGPEQWRPKGPGRRKGYCAACHAAAQVKYQARKRKAAAA